MLGVSTLRLSGRVSEQDSSLVDTDESVSTEAQWFDESEGKTAVSFTQKLFGWDERRHWHGNSPCSHESFHCYSGHSAASSMAGRRTTARQERVPQSSLTEPAILLSFRHAKGFRRRPIMRKTAADYHLYFKYIYIAAKLQPRARNRARIAPGV